MNTDDVILEFWGSGRLKTDPYTGGVWYLYANRGWREWRLFANVNTNGYLQYRPVYGGRRYVFLAHRVMWLVHQGRIEDCLIREELRTEDQVNSHLLDLDHKNSVRTDNRLSNLKPLFRCENVRKGARAKLTPELVIHLRHMWKTGLYTVPELHAMCKDVTLRTIERIIYEETWHGVEDDKVPF